MKHIIYLSIIAVLIWLICVNIGTMAHMESKHKEELNRLTDSLSKANGLIKQHGFKWPSEL